MTNQKKSLPNKPTYEELLSRIAELEAQLGDHKSGENEDKYHFLFDNLQETVIIYKVLRDEEGHIVDWIVDDCNILAKKNLGRPFEEAKGKRITELFGKKMVYDYILRSRRVDESREVESFETYFEFNQRYYSSKVFFITKDLYVNVSEDITERIQAEKESEKLRKQLIHAQKMEAIGTLAGGIAHDFNNILFPLLGFTEMLQDDLPKDSPLQKSVHEVLQAALRAKDLVKQILTFSRKYEQELIPVKVQSILEEAFKLIGPSLPKTIDIQTEIDPDCGLVLTDPTQIHQVIVNLATNAYHAMQKTGGRLKISLNQIQMSSPPAGFSDLVPGKYVLLKVTDTGTGIKKDVMDKIFDPYFTTKAKEKGTGLGLSVVRGIVKNYHGDIHIYSEPNKGTDVHVYLPIMEDESGHGVPLLHEPIQEGVERILLVDDEESIIKMEKMMLERLGYQVTARTNSIEALQVFKANPDQFDLILSDMTMPHMTGVQLAHEIKAIRTDIPIIICTGFSDQINVDTYRKIGIQGYVVKPVIKKEIAKIIRDVLDNQNDERENTG